MNMRLFFARPGVLVLLVGMASGVSVQGPKGISESTSPRAAAATTYRGGLVRPPLPKPRFTLIDTSGAPFDFWSKTQGVVTLLFFGYTGCPDECPLHVENIKIGLEKMPTALRGQVRLVFVTTDPARDNPKLLRTWLDRF